VFVPMFFDGLLMKSPAAFFSSHAIILPSHTIVVCEKLPRSIAFFVHQLCMFYGAYVQQSKKVFFRIRFIIFSHTRIFPWNIQQHVLPQFFGALFSIKLHEFEMHGPK
jgi:hypothetical protein